MSGIDTGAVFGRQSSSLEKDVAYADFRNALENNINIGATQSEMITFLLEAPERFKEVPEQARDTAIMLAIDQVQRTISMMTSMIRSLLETMRTIISNFRF